MKNLISNNKMPFIAGISFGYDLKRDDYFKDEPLHSLELLKQETGANAVIFAFHAMQNDPQSVEIDYKGSETPTYEGLKRLVDKARELELIVILKPMLDCANGTWRGHINFFDIDVPCEPKWSDWFRSYTEYQVHFAELAEKLNADMLCIACEMVQTQRREADWRACIAEIRKHYSGALTWNCDKYQEDQVAFWDALDVISASGYYPIDDWCSQLERIERVVKKFNKPFFFIECGCMSCKSSPPVPNNWGLFQREIDQRAAELGISVPAKPVDFSNENNQQLYKAVVDHDAQAGFFKALFSASDRFDFVGGFGIWDWHGILEFNSNTVQYDGDYSLHLKPSAGVIKEYFNSKL